MRQHNFTAADRDELQLKAIAPNFRQGKFDQGLEEMLAFIQQKLDAHGVKAGLPAAGKSAPAGVPEGRQRAIPATGPRAVPAAGARAAAVAGSG